MKNLLKNITLGLLAATSFANAESFVELNIGQIISEESKTLSIQPVSELVGGDSKYYELKYGLQSDDSTYIKYYTFVANAPDKNNEMMIGIGAELAHPIGDTDNMHLKIGSKVGYGWQSVDGDTAYTSTSANKVSYIINTQSSSPTTIRYTQDTNLLSIGLLLGLDYEITDNLKLNTDFTYRHDYYQVAYRNTQNTTVLNALTFQQSNYLFSIALNYRF